MNQSEFPADFTDFCFGIAKELAVHYDGIENEYDTYKAESMTIANYVKRCMEYWLTCPNSATLRQELNKIFDLDIQLTIKKNDYQSKVCPQELPGISFNRRTVRQRSTASSSIYDNRWGSTGLQRNSRQDESRTRPRSA